MSREPGNTESMGGVTFLTKNLPPPSDLYVGPDDGLLLRATNSASGVVVKITGMFLRPDGQLIPLEFKLAPTSDRTINTVAWPLGEGYLLSLAAFIDSGTLKRGQCFVQVRATRGIQSSRFHYAQLMSGYVSTSDPLGWPGDPRRSSLEGRGNLRSITGTDPAANVEIAETVPTGAQWLLYAVKATLVTDANVANRQSMLAIKDSAGVLVAVSPFPGTQAASLTNDLHWMAGVTHAVQILSTSKTAGLPTPMYLSAGFTINTVTSLRQVGDNYGAPQLLVEEWLEL